MPEFKIAIIDPVGGHADNYYNYGLAIGLAKADLEVYYFTSVATQKIEYNGVNTVFSFSNIWAKKNKVFKLWKYVIGLLKVFAFSKRKKIKTLHYMIFNVDWLFYFSVKLSKLFGFKVVATLHDVTSFTGDRLPASTEKNLINSIDEIIIHNEHSYNVINEIYPSDHYHVIEHGSYIPFIKKIEPQQLNDQEFRLLFFGQIKTVKGLDILLKALSILKVKGVKVKLTIAGRPWKVGFDEYQKMIDDYGINDMLDLHIKYIPNESVWDYFNSTNLVVLPYREIFQSGVLLMAMSYGRAVLTSDIPAFLGLVKDRKYGFTFKSESSEALATKLEEVINSKNTLPEIEENAYQYVDTAYDWNVSGLKTKAVYQKTL
jgi:D-inositol-3-phosphate glycosyltransferase